MRIGDWVQIKENDTPESYWPPELDRHAVGYISSLSKVDNAANGAPRDLWRVTFQLDPRRIVDLEFYGDELIAADAVSRLASISADVLNSQVLDLKKGQILLVEFGMSNVPRENAQKLVSAWRDEILKIAEKAGIPPENFPLLVVAGDIKFTTVDAVELLGLVGKTAG